MTPGRRYRGSAVMGRDGDFLFTPYAEQGEGANPWHVLEATTHAVLRETREVLQLRVTVPKTISSQPLRTMREIAFRVLVR